MRKLTKLAAVCSAETENSFALCWLPANKGTLKRPLLQHMYDTPQVTELNVMLLHIVLKVF